MNLTKSIWVSLFVNFALALSNQFLPAAKIIDAKRTIIWKIHDTIAIDGIKPHVIGSPQIIHENTRTALSFNGIDDGLIMPVNPLQEWRTFTVEVLFNPATVYPAAPRMLHIQDEKQNRCTIELRTTPDGKWYLDTFLKNGKTNKGLSLIDSTNIHPCDTWYWVALVYDGKKMTHYVNAVKEAEGSVDLEPMISGQASLGVRLNLVNWFKGKIREVRFHPTALTGNLLQHN